MQQRITPQESQMQRAKTLLAAVPPSKSKDWDTPEGRKFCKFVRELRDQGVPVAWVAAQLGLSPTQLYNLLNRSKVVSA
jgi:DNA invertase Pin-like site-specific DNA recombinase